MARTKNDFIQIAKRGRENGTRSDNLFDLERAERTSDDIFGEYEESHRSISSSNGTTTGMVLPTTGSNGSGPESLEGAEGSNRGIYPELAGPDRTPAIYGGTDRQARDGHTQPDKTQPKSIRTTPLDRVAHIIGKKPQKKKKEETLLTAQEGSKSRLRMIRFFLACTDVLDDSIQVISKGHRSVIIWSDLEEADAAILVDACIEMAKKSRKVATLYRSAVVLSYRFDAIKIILPRTARTILHLFTTGVSLK